MQPKPEVVIITYNSLSFIEACVESIGTEGEPIVVDNGSTDGTAEFLEQRYPEVHLIRSHSNRGYAAAVNRGVRASSGKVVMAVNADIQFEPGAIMTLADYVRAHPDVAVAGPQLVFPDGTWQRSYDRVPGLLEILMNLTGLAAFHRFVRRRAWPLAVDRSAKGVGYVDGAVWTIRREAFDQLGGLSESFFFYGEEVDFCARAKREGWEVHFVPQARVVHHRGGHTKKGGRVSDEYLERAVAANVRLHQLHSPRWRAGPQIRLEKVRWLTHMLVFRFLSLLPTKRRNEFAGKAESCRLRTQYLKTLARESDPHTTGNQ